MFLGAPLTPGPSTGFIETKDVVLMLASAILGGVIGWFTTWWFDRRSEQRAVVVAEADRARRGAQWVAKYLLDALDSQVAGGRLDAAAIRQVFTTLDEARDELILTDQQVLLDEAEDSVEALLDWASAGGPGASEATVRGQIQSLLRHAGGTP